MLFWFIVRCFSIHQCCLHNIPINLWRSYKCISLLVSKESSTWKGRWALLWLAFNFYAFGTKWNVLLNLALSRLSSHMRKNKECLLFPKNLQCSLKKLFVQRLSLWAKSNKQESIRFLASLWRVQFLGLPLVTQVFSICLIIISESLK